MTAFGTKLLALSGLTNYWPLEAGSGVAASGGHNMTVTGSFSTNGAPLLLDSAASTIFSGGSALTSAITFDKPQTFGGWYRPYGRPSSGIPTILGWGNGHVIGQHVNGRLFVLSQPGVTEVLQLTKTYMLTVVYDGAELHVYVNGAWSRNAVLGPIGQSGPSAFQVVGGNNGAVGHCYTFNRALGGGEILDLFLAGYNGARPSYTRVFELVGDGKPATVQVDTAGGFHGGNGYAIKALTGAGAPPRPSLAVAVAGHPVVSSAASVIGRCAGVVCGGGIRSNEAYVTLADGRPIHVACLAIDRPGVLQPKITAVTPTLPQWRQLWTRLLRDQVANKTIKTAGDSTAHAEKNHYLSVNERDHSASTNFATAYVSGSFATYDISNAASVEQSYNYAESAAAGAILQRYYDLPSNSWTRTYAEVLTDFSVNQLQNTNGAFVNGSGDDFYFPMLGIVTKLLGPYMPLAKYNQWKAALTLQAEHAIGSSTGVVNGFFCINSNRNLQNMLGVWMTYLVTGNTRWQRAFEMQYKIFCGGMPAVGSHAAAPARGFYETVPTPASSGVAGATAGDWSSGGATNAWNGVAAPHTEPTHKPYGFYTVRAATLADGSDGIGFLSEAHGAVDTGPDQNYLQYMLVILNLMLPWTDYDERFVFMSNMILNYLWPYLDQTGGQIVDQATGNAATSSYVGPWSLDVQGGVRSYGYSAQLFFAPIVFTLKQRGLRSGKPTGTPATIHPSGTGPAYLSPYEDLTDAHLKAMWTAVENYYAPRMGATGLEPATWKDVGKMMSAFLMNDPAFTVPTTPGLS